VRFQFVHCATLPRLAWCAHLRRGSGVASIYHGAWVETYDDWFVEGAWTGPFEKGEVDRALFNLGSGGVVRAARAVFCAQTDMIERLFSLRIDGDLFVSNSLSFVLAMAGDELDPCYPFYTHKLRGYLHDGSYYRQHKVIHTKRRRKVDLHYHCQVAVGDDLRLERIEKPVFRVPENFGEYVSILEDVIGGILENAASPRRRHRRYEGMATVSGGYDSNALAALAGKLGVREAITFYDKIPGNDSGEEVARLLGMTVRVYGRTDFRTAPGVDEAEFLSWPASDIVMASCEEHLVGRVLVMGRYGDALFGSHHSKTPGAFNLTRSSGAGASLSEFRLRTGFLNFNPFYAGGMHWLAIHQIAASEEMTPWRLGGRYDRPIARRIIEQAGVPRGMFGVTKAASAFYYFGSVADMSPAGRADFESYRRSMPRPTRLRHVWHRGLIRLRSECERVVKMIKSFWWTGGTAVESRLVALTRFQHWDDIDFVMHWGQARVRKRYAEAVNALSGLRNSDR
jgi:hypothetical protein